VNLIGEHTDYNEGLCLPFATPLGVTVTAELRDGSAVVAPGLPADDPYLRGALAELRAEGVEPPGCTLTVESDLPRDAGLSSSAALCVALVLALCGAAGAEPPATLELARLCSRIESDYTGARTGLLDQLASLLGRDGHAVRLDMRSLDSEPVELNLTGHVLAVLGSGATRTLAASRYNERRDECQRAAEALGVADRCSFVKASATDLVGVDDESVDVVATRSVLIYVADKERSFREFRRVLRAGGRVSLFEPINRFGMCERSEGFWGYPSDGLADLAQRVEGIFEAIQPPSDPMLDFDERDLVRLAESVGFFPIELDYHADIKQTDSKPWDAFLNSSGNPRIPTIAQAMEQALTPEERERFTEHLRPLVEEGRGVWRMGKAYLTAVKPL
jgi:SAM-dependent methyltransferase